MSEVLADTQSSVVVTQDSIQTAVAQTSETVTVDAGTPAVILSGLMGAPGASELSALKDIDISSLQDGGVLIYQEATQKWIATNTLERQILEGGQF